MARSIQLGSDEHNAHLSRIPAAEKEKLENKKAEKKTVEPDKHSDKNKN